MDGCDLAAAARIGANWRKMYEVCVSKSVGVCVRERGVESLLLFCMQIFISCQRLMHLLHRCVSCLL